MDAISGREIAVMEALKILEESLDENLILQHLGWVAQINPLLAVKVLTSDKRPNQHSPDEVIPAIDSKKVEILQRIQRVSYASSICTLVLLFAGVGHLLLYAWSIGNAFVNASLETFVFFTVILLQNCVPCCLQLIEIFLGRHLRVMI